MGCKIIIAGDLVVNKSYDVNKIDKDLTKLFTKADFKIVNLEAPITRNNGKILKTGPYLSSNEISTQNVIKNLEINIVTLANNHILDFGEDGIQDSLSFCKRNNIKSVGAGMNFSEASEDLLIRTSEGIIAIVNFAENEWSSAHANEAGANPMDIINNVSQIKKAKSKADYVFVIVHGGHEYYNLPSPRMQKQYRFYATQGADIVIGHHTHCISGNEIHEGVPIYYSLGNFLFTNHSAYEDWYTGLVLELEIKDGKITSLLHPVRQEKESFKLELLNSKDKQEVLHRIADYNAIITDSRKLNQSWERYIEFNYNKYIKYWSPISFIVNRYLKSILSRLGITGGNKEGLSLKLNLMRCEAHADMSKEVIKKYLKK